MTKITIIRHPVDSSYYARIGEYIEDGKHPNNPYINVQKEWRKWMRIGAQGMMNIRKECEYMDDFSSNGEFVATANLEESFIKKLGIPDA